MNPTRLNPQRALVRSLPRSFAQCLKLQAPHQPINVDLARQQHQRYVEVLRDHLKNIIELPADENHPDCCFVEDTAVIIGQKAAITRLGAPERQGEEAAVESALQKLGLETFRFLRPGTVDGGDVLFTGRHLFVGLSKRTNERGARELSGIFPEIPLITVPVRGTLHLKSVMSAFDEKTLIFAENETGQEILHSLQARIPLEKHYSVQNVPDAVASNVLNLGDVVVVQDGFSRSENILISLAAAQGKKIVKLQMSELIKADGALTCCSLLI